MRRRKSSRASASRRLKRQGKGSHSKARSPSLIRVSIRGESDLRNSATGPETSTSRSAAGSPSMPGPIDSQIALRVRCSAAESPGARFQPAPGWRSMRPISDQSQSATSTSEPSTRKLSR